MALIEFGPNQQPGHVIQVSLSETVNLALVWCPAGEFLIGSPDSDDSMYAEIPQHKVILTRGFWIGQIPVTQEQWLLYMDPDTILQPTGGSFPAFGMTWDDAREFCIRLTSQFQNQNLLTSNQVVDLPTEAQWEYACRAGTQTRWYFGDDPEPFGDHAWFKANSQDDIYPVGFKKPNPWQLHDCYGSVSEWCRDSSYGYHQFTGDVVDPYITDAKEHRFYIVRGGDRYDPAARWCRSASRVFTRNINPFNDPTGARVVCVERESTNDT